MFNFSKLYYTVKLLQNGSGYTYRDLWRSTTEVAEPFKYLNLSPNIIMARPFLPEKSSFHKWLGGLQPPPPARTPMCLVKKTVYTIWYLLEYVYSNLYVYSHKNMQPCGPDYSMNLSINLHILPVIKHTPQLWQYLALSIIFALQLWQNIFRFRH